MVDNLKRYLDIEAAAEYLAVSESYLYRLTSKKKIPFCRIGRRVVFDVRLLDEFIKRRRVIPRAWAFEEPLGK